MSLYDPPHLEVGAYLKCNCGTKELYHQKWCNVVSPDEYALARAREIVDRNARYWFGKKGKP